MAKLKCKYKGCPNYFFSGSLWALNSNQLSFCKKHYFTLNGQDKLAEIERKEILKRLIKNG